MYNYELKKESLTEISKQTFKDAIFLSYRDGITSIAPLGFSGDTIVLHGQAAGGRVRLVSVRNYGGSTELLITDTKGNFLFYGRYLIDLGIDFLAEQYWQIFNLVKDKIETIVEKVSDFKEIKINPNVQLSEGFDILEGYQKSKELKGATV